MYQPAARVALGLALAFAFTGCRSHKAQVADLQKQYDQLGKRYGKDCESEMINVPPKLSPKCAAEKQKLADTWNRLQAERAKK
jgi:hypothetical protein